ncbi:hypothetical protein HNQ71_004541 [Mesorhizobium sangaii]|uniref:HNH endonuclease n=1 Tax=Mesorhizobium sangaii TaxID=505389 RepID=A0A841PE57_9HYPH|nr:hypothetical protein [Mesorhizobium sangaii]
MRTNVRPTKPTKRQRTRCGLCGKRRLTTEEHVVPKNLYAPTRRRGKTHWIVIAACSECNNGTTDDDVHLRFVLALAGQSNQAVKELWETKITGSLRRRDGLRRAQDVYAIMRPVSGSTDHMIYPANDPRVLKSVRKIVRGLARHHGLPWPVHDAQVIADVLRGPELLDVVSDGFSYGHVQSDIFEYHYLPVVGEEGLHSVWFIHFFERTTFRAVVFQTVEDCQRAWATALDAAPIRQHS